MKTKSIIFYFILAVGFLGSQTASAVDGITSTQDLTLTVTGSAQLAVWGGSLALSLGGATQAGAAITPVTADTTKRLRISSLVTGTETRKITAQVTAGGLAGTQTILSVQLLAPVTPANFINYAAGGGGTLSGALLVVSSHSASMPAAVTLVTNIQTCWSGILEDDGYQINYKYEAVSGQTPTSSTATVTFTIAAV